MRAKAVALMAAKVFIVARVFLWIVYGIVWSVLCVNFLQYWKGGVLRLLEV